MTETHEEFLQLLKSSNKNPVIHENSDSKIFGQMTEAKPQPPGKTCSREREIYFLQ